MPHPHPPPFVVVESEESRKVMANQIAETSSGRYAAQNAFFAAYLYEHEDLREYLLEPWFIDGMAKAGDCVKRQRKYAKTCFLKVDPNLNNCPIMLRHLTYPMFSNYLSTRVVEKGPDKGKVFALSKSSYDQARSALMYYYKRADVRPPEDMVSKMGQYLRGISRQNAARKAKEGDSSQEGKRKMDFAVFQRMCELMLAKKDGKYAFAHLFVVLEWNLMMRAENCADAHIHHIE